MPKHHRRFDLQNLEFSYQEIQCIMENNSSLSREIEEEYSAVISAHLRRFVEDRLEYDLLKIGHGKPTTKNHSIFSRFELYQNTQAFIKVLEAKKIVDSEFLLSEYKVVKAINSYPEVLYPLQMALIADNLGIFQFILQEYIRNQVVVLSPKNTHNSFFQKDNTIKKIISKANEVYKMPQAKLKKFEDALKTHATIADNYIVREVANELLSLVDEDQVIGNSEKKRKRKDEVVPDDNLAVEPSAKKLKLSETIVIDDSKDAVDSIALGLISSDSSSDGSSPKSPNSPIAVDELRNSSGSVGIIDLTLEDQDVMEVDTPQKPSLTLMCDEELDFSEVTRALQSVNSNSPVKFKKPHTPERIREQRAKANEQENSLSEIAQSTTHSSNYRIVGSKIVRVLSEDELKRHYDIMRQVDWEKVKNTPMF